MCVCVCICICDCLCRLNVREIHTKKEELNIMQNYSNNSNKCHGRLRNGKIETKKKNLWGQIGRQHEERRKKTHYIYKIKINSCDVMCGTYFINVLMPNTHSNTHQHITYGKWEQKIVNVFAEWARAIIVCVLFCCFFYYFFIEKFGIECVL